MDYLPHFIQIKHVHYHWLDVQHCSILSELFLGNIPHFESHVNEISKKQKYKDYTHVKVIKKKSLSFC